MTQWQTLADIRRDYGDLRLSEQDVQSCPVAQFQQWFSDILKTETHDPTAMVLSTVDAEDRPDSRVVLLKGVDDDGAFIFYTNYNSIKAQQMRVHPHVALNFYWPTMARQVRIRGTVEFTNEQQSDEYFLSRPIASQWSALISQQSTEISNRAVLEEALEALRQKNETPIVRPEHWGGYRVIPYEMEFWQGRDNRLHDRIQYIRQQNIWTLRRLAP